MDIADMDFMQKLYFKNFEFSAKSDRLLETDENSQAKISRLGRRLKGYSDYIVRRLHSPGRALGAIEPREEKL
jgi:hypothetical protein